MPIWLRVILGIVGLLFLLLLPVLRVRIQAGETFALSIRYLFFTYRPKDGGEAVEKAAKKATPEKVKKAKDELPKKVSLKLGVSVEEVLDLLAELWPPLRRMIRAVKITGLRLHITVGSPDAADTAIGYGKMCGYVSAGSALLFNIFKKVEIQSLAVEPDFLAESNRYDLDVTIGMRPIRLIYTLFVLVGKALPLLIKIMFPKKAEPRRKAKSEEAAPAS